MARIPADIDRTLALYERGALSRRDVILWFGAALAAARVAGAQETPPAAAPEPPTFAATALNHVALRVTDVARSRDFYARHLGLQPVRGDAGSAFLRCGPDFLALFRAGEAAFDHYCYTIEGYDPARAHETLTAAGLAPRREGDRVYFDDPDGHEVQVSAPNDFADWR